MALPRTAEESTERLEQLRPLAHGMTLGAALQAAPAEARARLTAATNRFQDVLTLHGRVLMRIRNASEGIIKAVAEEVEKRRSRARPYSPAHGARPNAPRPASSSLLYNAVV